MSYIPLQKLMQYSGSLYRLVIAASVRATELADGQPALVKSTSKKVSTIALEEMAEGKVKYVMIDKSKESSPKTEA